MCHISACDLSLFIIYTVYSAFEMKVKYTTFCVRVESFVGQLRLRHDATKSAKRNRMIRILHLSAFYIGII